MWIPIIHFNHCVRAYNKLYADRMFRKYQQNELLETHSGVVLLVVVKILS